MTLPLVSVLIPVYNADPYVRDAIESILNQTYSELEILICDDTSTDRTSQLLTGFADPRIVLFRNAVNMGYLRTINFLAEKAKGQFFCFQDADDVSHPNRIQTQINLLEARPDLGLVGTNYAVLNANGKVLHQCIVETDSRKLREALQSSNPFQKPSILFRREVYEKVGMYREGFLTLGNISEDFDWILRVSECFDIGNVNHPEPLYFYRALATAMTKDIKSVDQFFGHQVAIMLLNERRGGKIDSIDRGDFESLDRFISQLRIPYELDSSLFHHRLAASLMYAGLNARAIKQSLIAVAKEPLKWRNYRLLQYCLRKTLIGL